MIPRSMSVGLPCQLLLLLFCSSLLLAVVLGSPAHGSQLELDTQMTITATDRQDPSFCTWNGYNFSTLALQTQITVKQTMYFISPCAELTGIPSCGARSSACFVAAHHHAPEVDDLGDVDTVRFSYIDPLNTTVGVELSMTGENDCVATNGSSPVPFETRVLFVCAPTTGNMTVTPLWSQCIITFTQQTPLACSNATFEGDWQQEEQPSPLFPENDNGNFSGFSGDMDLHSSMQAEWEAVNGHAMNETADMEEFANNPEGMEMDENQMQALMAEAAAHAGQPDQEMEMEGEFGNTDAAVEISSQMWHSAPEGEQQQFEEEGSSIFGEAQ